MNKKKIALIALAVVCVLGCAFALAACGEKAIEVTSVTLDKTTLSMQVGAEQTLTATVNPDDATQKTVTWTSSNTAVATVANGKVTAVAAGTATITAKAGEKTATCAVTVTAATDPLAGKKFVFAKIESATMDAATKAQYAQMNGSVFYQFDNDGKVTQSSPSVMQGMPSVENIATYTIDGSVVTLSIVSVTFNGVPQDVSQAPPITLTFDGTYLIQAGDNQQGTTFDIYFQAEQEQA